MGACTLETEWLVYVLTSIITFLGGLVILLPIRLAWYLCRDKRRAFLGRSYRSTQKQLTSFRSHAESILNGTTLDSKIAVIVFWIVDVTVILVYLIEASSFDPENRDDCGSVKDDELQRVWLALMCVNLLRFIIKFFAAHDKTFMWIDFYSFVDHFTIVPSFVGLYLDRNWLGLRFLTAIHLLRLPDVLQLIHILKNRSSIRIVRAVTIVLTMWLMGAGMILILENNGDPWKDYKNNAEMFFGDCFYFILITLTTIGYGDISPKTILGKTFIIVFVVLALALFGSLIPELGKALGSRNKYRKAYNRSYGKRHVVICGDITFETLSTVIRNFIHEDAGVEKTDIVIIDKEKPSTELQAFFKRRFNDVTFIQGTVIDIPTIKLAKTDQASAVFILANRRAENQNEEDSANIMRATALKNLSPDIRIIIQLLQHQNKEQLLNIPSWNWHKQDGDEVICISELKMALMAQNCLAPGIVTMFSNLISMRSFKSSGGGKWMDDYKCGAGHEIYSHIFTSRDFADFTFAEAAEICYTNFGVLLVAVECEDGYGRCTLKVNPVDGLIIREGYLGFFMAQGPTEMNRVAKYTQNRYENPANSASLSLKQVGVPAVTVDTVASEDNLLEYLGESGTDFNRKRGSDVGLGPEMNNFGNNNQVMGDVEMLDVTGMVHWTLSKQIQDVLLDEDTVREHSFENHIIFVLHSDNNNNDDQDLGLSRFVCPLRASSLRHDELKPIVFYSDLSTLENEWTSLTNFPKLYVYKRSRSIHGDLRSLNVHKCSMCIVSTMNEMSMIDETLIDKNVILTTMNILSLQKIEEKINTFGVLANPEIFRKQIALQSDFPMLAQLEHDASIAYIDDDDDDDPSVPLYQTTPYACGRVLLASVLDSMVTTAYLNGRVLKLIRALVTGGEGSDLEKIMADGVGIVRKATLTDVSFARKRSSLSLLSTSYGPLEKFRNFTDYGQLLVNALRDHGLLCLGLYRLLDTTSKDPRRQKRYVITNPAYTFPLLPSDKVYVLKPFSMNHGSNSV